MYTIAYTMKYAVVSAIVYDILYDILYRIVYVIVHVVICAIVYAMVYAIVYTAHILFRALLSVCILRDCRCGMRHLPPWPLPHSKKHVTQDSMLHTC